MTLIASKRLQQGVFEALASSNRAAGSGGGSGLNALQFLGQGSDSAADTISTTGYTLVPGVSFKFNLGRAQQVFISVLAIAKLTTTGAGNYAYMHRFLDGNDYGPVGIWDIGNGGNTTSSFFTPIDTTGLFLAPGTHTVDLRVHVDNVNETWTNALTAVQVYVGS